MENLQYNHHPTYFIADIAANHDGDLERAKELIFLAESTDAVKFQYDITKYVSDKGFKTLGGKFSHQSKWEKSILKFIKIEVPMIWTSELNEISKKLNIDFFQLYMI